MRKLQPKLLFALICLVVLVVVLVIATDRQRSKYISPGSITHILEIKNGRSVFFDKDSDHDDLLRAVSQDGRDVYIVSLHFKSLNEVGSAEINRYAFSLDEQMNVSIKDAISLVNFMLEQRDSPPVEPDDYKFRVRSDFGKVYVTFEGH